MKMKIDLSQFKLKNKTDKHATLVHPDGHEFKVAVSALHPENRKNFDKLKMAEGGEVSESDIMEAKKQTDEYNKTHEDQPSGYPKEVEGYLKSHEPKKYAGGGEIDGDEYKRQLISGMNKAFGNKPSKPEPKPQPKMYADGGEIPFDKLIPQEQADAAPYGLTPAQAQMAPQAQQAPAPQAPAPMPGAPSVDIAEPQAPQAAPEDQGQEPQAAQEQPQMAPQPPQAQSPDIMHGYGEQQAGIAKQSAAESEAAKTTEATLMGQAKGLQNTLDQYQSAHKEIDDEVKNFQQDIVDGHIDPNHYLGSMDTGQKIATGIALALGGLGGSLHGGGNQALDFLNKQIDRDIDAQKAALGKKETLLSAAMRKYGNLRDATDMTRMMMMAGAQTGIQAAQAKANSQVALARGQQLSGQLEAQIAPLVQQAAMRKMLEQAGQNYGPGGGPSHLIKEDPAKFVASQVPTEHQKGVFAELERAENTRRMTPPILKAFDESAEALTGLGRAGALVKRPRELNALHQLISTTVTDLTGTARQAEFDAVEKNLLPNQYDTAADKATKRQALVQYLQAKTAAPIAKGYGIDLEKFESTALRPESRLSPDEKFALDWARQNPNNPASKKVFKKLGINE